MGLDTFPSDKVAEKTKFEPEAILESLPATGPLDGNNLESIDEYLAHYQELLYVGIPSLDDPVAIGELVESARVGLDKLKKRIAAAGGDLDAIAREASGVATPEMSGAEAARVIERAGATNGIARYLAQIQETIKRYDNGEYNPEK